MIAQQSKAQQNRVHISWDILYILQVIHVSEDAIQTMSMIGEVCPRPNSLVHGASNMVIICYGNCLLPDPCQVPPLILTYFIVNWNKQRKCHLQNDNFVKAFMYWIPIVELDHILSCNKSWAIFRVLLINFNSKGDCLLDNWFYSKLFHPIHNWYLARIQLELIYQRECSVETLAQLHRQHRW